MVKIVKYKTGIDNNSLLGHRNGDSYVLPELHHKCIPSSTSFRHLKIANESYTWLLEFLFIFVFLFFFVFFLFFNWSWKILKTLLLKIPREAVNY